MFARNFFCGSFLGVGARPELLRLSGISLFFARGRRRFFQRRNNLENGGRRATVAA